MYVTKGGHMRRMGRWSGALLALVAAGAAQAQREEVIGVVANPPQVEAYAQPDGGEKVRLVPAAELAHKPRVLETSADHSRVRVNVGGQDLWLERRALRLKAEVNATCHVVATSRDAPPMGAGRGANSGCAPARP